MGRTGDQGPVGRVSSYTQTDTQGDGQLMDNRLVRLTDPRNEGRHVPDTFYKRPFLGRHTRHVAVHGFSCPRSFVRP